MLGVLVENSVSSSIDTAVGNVAVEFLEGGYERVAVLHMDSSVCRAVKEQEGWGVLANVIDRRRNPLEFLNAPFSRFESLAAFG